MIKIIKKYIKKNWSTSSSKILLKEREQFLKNGSIPWSKGYTEYKEEVISNSIKSSNLLSEFREKIIPENFGFRLDERVIEYPWIFSKLNKTNEKLLDAGSTFNFNYIINHEIIKNKDLTIFTYAPENVSYNKKRISYVYGDLRELPFKDSLFDAVISQSTIEHIDMDNSMYGYSITHNKDANRKSYEFIFAVKEMIRVLKSKGNLLLTFPYGKFENHGFFQQFDEEMLNRLLNLFDNKGVYELDFFIYKKQGWQFANKDELVRTISYNPHSGEGKLDDGAAHCRSVACVHFIKS